MTKDKIIKTLKANIATSLRLLKVAPDYKDMTDEYNRGQLEGLRTALHLVEAMHDDEYWNEAIADAIAMGDR